MGSMYQREYFFFFFFFFFVCVEHNMFASLVIHWEHALAHGDDDHSEPSFTHHKAACVGVCSSRYSSAQHGSPSLLLLYTLWFDTDRLYIIYHNIYISMCVYGC